MAAVLSTGVEGGFSVTGLHIAQVQSLRRVVVRLLRSIGHSGRSDFGGPTVLVG